MAVALVQSIGTYNSGGVDGNTIVLSVSKTVSAGNVIVVASGFGSTGGTPSCADNLGNTYASVESTADAYHTCALFVAPVTTGGSLTTITVTMGHWSVDRTVIAAEFSGVNTLSVAGGGTSGVSGTGTWVASKTIPANGAAFGLVAPYDARTQTIGSASGSPSTTAYIQAQQSAAAISLALCYAIAGGSEVTGFSGTTTFTSNEWVSAGGVYSGTSGSINANAGVATGTGAANLASFATASGDYAGTIAAQGAIAHWRLGEAAGTTAADAIGSADGTYVNTPTLGASGLLSGDANTAVTFARTSLEHVSVPSGIPAGSATGATISARVALASTAEGNYYTVVRWGAESATVGFHWLYYRQYSATEYLIYWEYADGTAYRKAWTGWQPVLGQAYSLAAVHDYAAETVKFYVDGTLLDSKDVSAYGTPVSVAANTPTFIGAYSATQHTWDGTLDEPAIFDLALSATDIADQHEAATTGSPPETAHPSAAASAGTAHDASAEGTLPPGLTLQQYIDATPTGGSLDVTGYTFTAGATISRAITITGGTIAVPSGSVGLRITASNVTIDGMTITGRQATTYNTSEYGIYAYGTHAAHLTGLTIRDCTISNFGYACIWYTHTTGTTIYGNTLSDAVYVGVMAYCAWNSTISWNRIADIGETANVAVSGRDLYNAYGIAVTGYTGINSQDVEVTDNWVSNVPWWHGVDTHSGIRVGFRRNVIFKCSRGVFITSGYGSPTDIEIEANHVLDPAPVTFNLRPITFADATNVTVWDNRIIGWGVESPTETTPWYDYASGSTGLVNAGGNRVVSGKGAAAAVHASGELVGAIPATGTAHQATFASGVTVPDRDANAGCATATGTAHAPAAWLLARTAAATGTVPAPSAAVKASAGAATATGTAHGSSRSSIVAAGAGAATDVRGATAPTAQTATGTGTAGDATASKTSSSSILETATATGGAYGTSPGVGATNATAAGTGAAANASATTVSGAFAAAGCATATGTANDAPPRVAPGPSVAAGTAEAYEAATLQGSALGVSTATGAAYGVAPSLKVYAGAAAAVGAAVPLSFSLLPNGGIADGSTGAALAGSTAVAASTGTAGASGSALNVTWASTSTGGASAGVAAASGIAWSVKKNAVGGRGPVGRGHHHRPRGDAAPVQ